MPPGTQDYEDLTAREYLVSTNGDQFGHPDPEAIGPVADEVHVDGVEAERVAEGDPLRRALGRLDPGDARTRAFYGHFLALMSRPVESSTKSATSAISSIRPIL